MEIDPDLRSLSYRSLIPAISMAQLGTTDPRVILPGVLVEDMGLQNYINASELPLYAWLVDWTNFHIWRESPQRYTDEVRTDRSCSQKTEICC